MNIAAVSWLIMVLPQASINKHLPTLLGCIFFLLLNTPAQSKSFNLTPGYREAYLELLRLRFDNANQLIKAEEIADPSNVTYAFLYGYIDFLKYSINEETVDYDRLVTSLQDRIDQLNQVSESSPWRLNCQAQLYLQSGLASMKNGNYFRAANDISKSYSLFKRNEKLFPDFLPGKAGLGLMNVLFGSVPDSFKWVTTTLGFEGDVSRGSQLLRSVIDASLKEYPFLYNESLFLYTFITFNFSSSTQSDVQEMEVLYGQKHVRKELAVNPLLIYSAASLYLKNGNNDEALKLLVNRPLHHSYYPFHYLDYLTGIAYLNKIDPRCRLYFLKYINNYKGDYFIKSAYQKLAWSYLALDDEDNYKKYISRVKLFGEQATENDKEAQFETSNGKVPQKELLKARLLCDGGYYDKAENVLIQLNQNLLQEIWRNEYYYRLARIKHQTGHLTKAKELYIKTFQTGKNLDSWYPANSLLMLGTIHEEEGDIKKAHYYYSECLKQDFTLYKSGIHQKAMAGMSRTKRGRPG